jgi:deoxyribodipyrimidine photolyase-related protein
MAARQVADGLASSRVVAATRRWSFADQLGPHFLDAPDQRRRARRPGPVPADRHLRGGAVHEPLSVCAPTTWAARDLVLRRPGVTLREARAFVTRQADFRRWAARRTRERLLMDDVHRTARRGTTRP